MTARAKALPFLAGGVIVASVVFGAAACSGARTEGLDPSKVPENLRADYDLFARRCSKCHSLARPLNAGITDDDQWVMYVNRMRRQPGSGISYEDQDQILRFLRWYAADLRRKEAERRPSVPPPPASSSVPTSSSPPVPAGERGDAG